ncbi:C4-dicarboxylate transport sensor protein DctB [Lacunisphaera limnophila]|uniref:histidine kinase n=1 Tax=Lacunisphaera limnophila TaxID=1838286 RepID=A0A1D8AXC8_9BACT|nr:ATP-binding protein [Lacunisphaera limnophila]AOS45543.1 C4-dicarboxylate transport sensor protein DctB [Lacunisphaera limnophila]
MAPPRKRRVAHENLVFYYTLLGGLPAAVVAFTLLLAHDYTPKVQWTLGLLIVSCWLGFALAVRERVVRPLQTMANLLTALREGDFSTRARGANRDEPLGDVLAEINLLSGTLQEQRLGALEATALLRTVMEEIDVAIFAFDANETLRLVNRAGQELIAQPAERILGRPARDLDLADCLVGEGTRVLSRTFPGGTGRWGMRRTVFREGGLPHSLVVIADLSQPLREEELKAWQRLVRVIGHELNNSLAPIKSIAGSLNTILRRPQKAPDWEDDMRGGLEIIESRAEGLNQFMQSYARLAKLPAPSKQPCEIGPLLRRVIALETSGQVELVDGPALTVHLDAAQLEQVIINLVKNAVEAAFDPGQTAAPPCRVRVAWQKLPGALEITVTDDGPGLANLQNLFVPFFTTKPSGSGIGLVLCRQIAENHHGTLTLENRTDHTGCLARLRLPF